MNNKPLILFIVMAATTIASQLALASGAISAPCNMALQTVHTNGEPLGLLKEIKFGPVSREYTSYQLFQIVGDHFAACDPKYFQCYLKISNECYRTLGNLSICSIVLDTLLRNAVVGSDSKSELLAEGIWDIYWPHGCIGGPLSSKTPFKRDFPELKKYRDPEIHKHDVGLQLTFHVMRHDGGIDKWDVIIGENKVIRTIVITEIEESNHMRDYVR